MPVSPLVDLPVDVLERCARFGELRTFHGLVVVLGYSRRPTAAALKRSVRDDRLSPSALFSDARKVRMTFTDTHPYSHRRGQRVSCRISDRSPPLHECLTALERAARADDYYDWEEAAEAALAGRRAAAIRLVRDTVVYHGVASLNGTNDDHGGYETVGLLSVARPAARCLPGALEAPRLLFAVTTAKSTPGFYNHDGQVYKRFGVYVVLDPEPEPNERRAALVDAAWEILDPEGTGFVERASFFEAHDASRHPRVTYLSSREEWERYVESSTRDEERILRKWYERSAGVDRAGHVSRREFQMYYAEFSESEDIEDDEAFERLLDVWTVGETLSVEISSGATAPSPLRPCSQLVRLVHASAPQTFRNPDNWDDHEHIHTATAETCAEVAERLGLDVESLGYLIKAVALVANLRGKDGLEWKEIERISKDDESQREFRRKTRWLGKKTGLSAFCDTFPRFGRDEGERTTWDPRSGEPIPWIEYPLGEDLFYSRSVPGTFGARTAADHELGAAP